MADTLPPGPYKTLTIDGQSVPWYIVPFDKAGECTGPRTRQHLVDAAAAGNFTDIFLFSHGWNNDWKAASNRYDDFIGRYSELRLENSLTYVEPHRPLLVGIFWPSTALVAPWESAPKFAAAPVDNATRDEAVGESQRELEELATLIAPEQRTRFYELLQGDQQLSSSEERELAEILSPAWSKLQSNVAGDLNAPASISPNALLELWHASATGGQAHDGGLDPNDEGGLADAPAGDGPSAAFGLGDILKAPRDLLRTFTVLQMKDRAATVGARGVGPLLRDLLTRAPTARVHLIGHSYGCVVVLSALCYPPTVPLPRPVDSVLLLQAAVSRLCFAARVPGHNYAGGYRDAFSRVNQPILATFTNKDVPLTKLFHIAVRRDKDLGQATIAAAPAAPSQYAALGGFGPDGCSEAECEYVRIHHVGDDYALRDNPHRIIALQSNEAISGHGEVSVPETWWALYNQVRAGR